jgi:hypothetical protein
MDMTQENDDELFDSLMALSEQLDQDEEINRISEQSIVELKSDIMQPIYDEYWGGNLVDSIVISQKELSTKAAKKKPVLRDPKGGLTAAGRAYFKRKEGANLKPGVRGPANTPEKMRRKGSFLTHFFSNPSGPMKDEKGRATRLALSAAAWGEPVPQNAEDAAALAAKGRRMLERYAKSKKKKKSLADGVVISAQLSTKAIFTVTTPTDMNGIAGKDGGDFFSNDLNEFEETQRRRLIREELVNHMIDQSTNGKSYIGGSAGDIKRMESAHNDMLKMRKKKNKVKTQKRKA